MKNHPENLAAWLDNELPEAEAAVVTDHVEECAECRDRVRAYADLTDALEIYRAGGTRGRWKIAAAWAGAIAAGIVLVAVLLSQRKAPEIAHVPPVPPQMRVRIQAVEAPAAKVAAVPRRATPRRPAPAPAAAVATPVAYEGPVIRVALSADSLFPPGAVPPGLAIYADVTLAADGTPHALRVLP